MRFAHEYAPAAPPKTFWILVAVFFLLMTAPIVVINLAVDPFDFRIVPHKQLERERIIRRNDAILWSAVELKRIPKEALANVTIVACGDSRTEILTGGRRFCRIFKLGEDQVLSLSVGGASFDESIALLKSELPKMPKLRGVILSIPLERIGVVEGNRVQSALNLADSPLRYVFNLNTFLNSLDVLREQEESEDDETPGIVRPDVDQKNIIDVSGEQLDIASQNEKTKQYANATLKAREMRVVKQWVKKITGADAKLIEKRTAKTIIPLTQELEGRGVKTVFYFPPLRPEVLASLDENARIFNEKYVSSLSKIGTVENYINGDKSGIPIRFADGSHPYIEAAHSILADIYLRNFASEDLKQKYEYPKAGH